MTTSPSNMASLRQLAAYGLLSLSSLVSQPANALTIDNKPRETSPSAGRERVSINSDWKFWRSEKNPDGVIYDQRKDLENLTDVETLKPWILPSANDFINDPADWYKRPNEEPSTDVPYVYGDFDDGEWEDVTLPHDWAIKGPFYTEDDDVAIVGGGMGRLPVHGVGWYRRSLEITPEDEGKQIYLDIDGAMSYAMVWLNGVLVGGWPYPYNSFRLDLTPHAMTGRDNQLAIRLDNPTESARWYPGGGLYRSVWLTKVGATHVGQWGTFVMSKDVSDKSASLDLVVEVENNTDDSVKVKVVTTVHPLDPKTGKAGERVAEFPKRTIQIGAGQKESIKGSTKVKKPSLWGPIPTQTPNLYVAVTKLYNSHGGEIDSYETQFGIRSVEFTPSDGIRVNGERIQVQGVNQHHDLGAIGAAFNVRAAERQLESLQAMGTNAIRMSHNPPARELLDLTDRIGFLVMDEVFDSWRRNKTDCDFHLIFPDWHEADLRAFIRRDRNHASVIAWSFGNEVVEQQHGEEGAVIGNMLHNMIREEDTTRPTTASMNYAQPDNNGAPFPDTMDILSLNYQGAGIRDTPNYSNLDGIRTDPAYPKFREAYPDKLILTSESASSLSTRGTYIFPVAGDMGAPVNETSGGNKALAQVSAYELYTADFGSSPDKVFGSQDRNPYVAGEFVWTGWDYIGEPTPYYQARSSYSGIIDLAGFKKSRFWLYQARWRPELPMAHVLPHWNWPDREGEATPVHVFTSGDEAELFLNGKSLGRRKMEESSYRLRWDDVEYTPGELRVVAYKDGEEWAEDTVRTTGKPAGVHLKADRAEIDADGYDLSFITAEVVDDKGGVVPDASNTVSFSVGSGPGRIEATDNGDPYDLVAFPSTDRKAYSGLALAVVRSLEGERGEVKIVAESEGLKGAEVVVKVR